MKNNIYEQVAERISAGLKRKSLTTCSRWACACRVMGKPFPGPWSWRYHPWLKEMHDSTAQMNIGQKSAQMGYTETALNIAFYNIDIKQVDVLYVLPAKTPDATDFSAARFDPALELSPHLSRMFSDVKNVGHKRAGTTNLYVRGSRSRAGLKSVPVGLIILDEVDEMDQANIPLALERAAGQLEKQDWLLSTPTIDNAGINHYFLLSTQEKFVFKCPLCSRSTFLKFPECMEITAEDFNDPDIHKSFLRCMECKGRLEHKLKNEWLQTGVWIADKPGRDMRGFHVNQLYSFTVSPAEFAKAFLRSLKTPADEQEFFNSKLGLPHTVEGARVTDKDIDNCRGSYTRKDKYDSGLITMGVDVGRWLHYEIDRWTLPSSFAESVDLNIQSKCQVLTHGKVQHFEELDLLMRQFGVQHCIIDANPERRKAFEFASRHPGHVSMCFYGRGIRGKQINIGTDEEPTITVDRTSWLDLSLGRFRNQSLRLPNDIDLEYRAHLKALVRMYEKDPEGNPVGRYIKSEGDDDHYAHSRNYAEIALPFAAGIGECQSIESPI